MSEPVKSITHQNLEAALAGEAMAHAKYLYFARICRAAGDVATAELFEETAKQEIQHAFGHLDVIYPQGLLTPKRCLEMAIAGETYEYTEMYPTFREQAEREKLAEAVAEFDEQITESKEHSALFRERLQVAQLHKAERRFAALIKVEQRHAEHYRRELQRLS